MFQWLSNVVEGFLRHITALSFVSSIFIPKPTLLPLNTPLPLDNDIATPSVSVTVQTGGQKQERTVTDSDGTTVSQSITTSDAKAEASQTISGNTNGNAVTVKTNSGGNIQKIFTGQ